MIRWDTCRQDFEWDGSLRDIYVHDTTTQDWRAVFDGLQQAYALEYSVDGASQPLPDTIDRALSIRGTAAPMLRVRTGSVMVVCHFFCVGQIEFDIDPRDIASQSALDELLGFLRVVGDAVRRTVILTPENVEEHPFITYEPSRREFEYHKYPA